MSSDKEKLVELGNQAWRNGERNLDKSELMKVTLYFVDPWSGGPVRKVEGKLLECGYQEYAQYNHCPYVIWYPKRKRQARELVVYGSDPYFLLLKGWGHPDPDSPFDVVSTENGVTVSRSRHLWVGGPWESEFNEKIENYLKDTEVVLDYRVDKAA